MTPFGVSERPWRFGTIVITIFDHLRAISALEKGILVPSIAFALCLPEMRHRIGMSDVSVAVYGHVVIFVVSVIVIVIFFVVVAVYVADVVVDVFHVIDVLGIVGLQIRGRGLIFGVALSGSTSCVWRCSE